MFFFSFIILLPCTVISFYLFTNSTQEIILLKKKINYTEKKIIFLREKFDILNAKKIFEEKEGSVLEIEKIIDTKIKKYKSNIEKFVIFKDKEEGFFQVEFNVQNKTNKNENLIGRLFIILDPKFEGIKPIVFPSYALDRKKIDATKGHYFSFVNSAIFRFKIKSSETLEKFKKCIILLYSMDGKLIKEKKILIRKSLEANL